MNPAMHARIEKEKFPERYCAVPRCLWNTHRSGPCQKHETHIPLCGAFYPSRPMLSCVMAHGHGGQHRTRYAHSWTQTEEAKV